jgi:hypothetical protein
MSENNLPNLSFTELCSRIGEDAELIKTLTKKFIGDLDAGDRWDSVPPGTREKMLELVEVMENDDIIHKEMVEFMGIFSKLVMHVMSEDNNSEPMSSMAEGIEEHPEDVRALVNAAMMFTESAEAIKVEMCSENGGPVEIPGTLVYMVPVENGPKVFDPELFDSRNYNMYVSQLDIPPGEEPFTTIKEVLDEAFEMYGTPAVLSFICDTYMREFDSVEEATGESGRREILDMEREFFSPTGRVEQALASIVMTKNTPVVTTVSKYRYDDKGQPDFIIGQASYAVNPTSEILQDPSHRGAICSLFASYLCLGEEISN